MKRLLIFIGISLSLTAYGQAWEPIVESETQVEYSYDPSSVKREGNSVTYWELSDYKNPLRDGNLIIMSIASKVVQDCKNSRYKVTDMIQYDGHKGMGNVVNVVMSTQTNWYTSVSESVNSAMQQLVCK